MAELSQCRVSPKKLYFDGTVVLTKQQKRAVPGLGGWAVLMGIVLTFIFAYLFLGLFWLVGLVGDRVPAGGDLIQAALALLPITCAVIISYMISQRVRQHKWRRLEQELLAQKHDEFKRDVRLEEEKERELTSNLIKLVNDSESLAAQLPKTLERAMSLLQYAEAEYGENAFDPYWNAVEKAASSLSSFGEQAEQLAENADTYYELLSEREHTFPAFPIRPEFLPDPQPVIQEFRRVVRLGQTNFQFANIWQHRETRGVLVDGFDSLSDAVNGLGEFITESVLDLQDTTSGHLALIEGEARKNRTTLDRFASEQQQVALEQNQTLKKIQRSLNE